VIQQYTHGFLSLATVNMRWLLDDSGIS